MRFIKILLVICILMVQCSVLNTSECRIKKELSEYKYITNYFISKNYNNDFKKTRVYDYGSLPNNDSLLYNFMVKKNILVISSIAGDSLIEFHFFYTPLFGTRKQLIFDLSHRESKLGPTLKEIEKKIYYNEY